MGEREEEEEREGVRGRRRRRERGCEVEERRKGMVKTIATTFDYQSDHMNIYLSIYPSIHALPTYSHL